MKRSSDPLDAVDGGSGCGEPKRLCAEDGNHLVGDQAPAAATGHLAEAVAAGDTAPALDVAPQSRIEVLWTLAVDDSDASQAEGVAGDDDVRSLWWAATVVGATGRTHKLLDPETNRDVVTSGLSVPVYELRYDSRTEEGFPREAQSEICFVSERRLLDLQFDGLLFWRHCGSTWEPGPSDSEDGEDVEDEVGGVETAGLSQLSGINAAAGSPAADGAVVLSAPNELVESVLSGLLRAYEGRLKQMPASQQLAIADRIAAMREKLVARILHYQQEHSDGDGSVAIDGNAMRAIIADLHTDGDGTGL